MSNEIKISVVIPVYGCKTALIELYLRLKQTLTSITEDFEIIMVNDASPDGAWETIVELANKDKRVKGINFSRNFGQHYAITAGLDHCNGEWIVVMDCDLQDKPDEIPNLYKKAQEGFQSVFAQRIQRNDSIIKRKSSQLFYALFSYLTETRQDSSVANFGIYHKSVIKAILSMKDQVRYFPTMVQWVGFNKAYLPVKHDYRFEGKSSYNFKRLSRLAIDTIISFSDKPLRLTVKMGFFTSSASFIVGLLYFLGYLLGKITVSGFASLVISIWFLAGVIIFLLGILGMYLGKTFEKVKNRPLMIIKDIINEK